MVNYRRVVCEVALIGALVSLSTAAPVSDCTHTHYDQRQNGSENYRLSIDGVVVAVAPAESLFSALGDMDDVMSELLTFGDFGDLKPPALPASTSPPGIQIVPVPVEGDKPVEGVKPASESQDSKPQEVKPEEAKPQEEKPQDEKPEAPAKPADLSDISLDDDKIQKKEVPFKKQEKGKRSP